MHTSFILDAAKAIQQSILNNEAALESLDREIGDGDHYINMKRGAQAIVSMQEELVSLSAALALNKIGLKLLSTLGGASGPLLASFFMSMAKQWPAAGKADLLSIALAFDAGVQAIMLRGKAGLGEKTMLDVLIPVSQQFKQLAEKKQTKAFICIALMESAEQGLINTRDLIATKGRAAGLGERAMGHLDPGAKSCQLIITAVCQLALAP
ncbi:DAK1 Dihydroxyacetone kinase [Methylophilaceae bacterium]|jgi:dihydroxyacetone kinase-like protein